MPEPLRMPFADTKTARLINQRIEELKDTKSQREIAFEMGYDKPNILSMIKRGETKLPIDKVGVLARALEVDPSHLFRLVFEDYFKTVAEEIFAALGPSASHNEQQGILKPWRAATGDLDPIVTPQRMAEIAAFFRSICVDVKLLNNRAHI